MSSIWSELKEAKKRLLNHEPVAIPTETVYGLAAPISSPKSIENVFKLKGRPSFDPLIVHVDSIDQARSLTLDQNLGPITKELMGFFWPGPLTFILPKSEQISERITSGLPTVGIRCPAHPIARRLIRTLGTPLAAPSANRFGRTSPTRAQHVKDEFKAHCFVVDGGASVVGIESTILEVDENKLEIKILRPGHIGPKALEDFSRHRNFGSIQIKKVFREKVPGSEEKHYLPEIPVVTSYEMDDSEILKGLQKEKIQKEKTKDPAQRLTGEPKKILLSRDPFLAARELYHELRQAHLDGHSWAWVQIPHEAKRDTMGHWEPLFDRLKRASYFYRRD